LDLLIGETFSPWTRKARWALDYCAVAYRYREYTPLLSEPRLRMQLGQWRGAVSVPVLLTADGAVRGSFEIARHAAGMAGDGRLGDFQAIRPWDDVSEAGLASARTRVVRAIARNEEALDESIRGVPAFLRPLPRAVTRRVVERIDRKYAHLAVPDGHRTALLALRRGLHDAGTGFLQAAFSYADITLCALLDAVAPDPEAIFPGDGQRACWHDDALAREFADLLRWRDSLRPYRSPPAAR
jgi:glutathione S-transferase